MRTFAALALLLPLCACKERTPAPRDEAPSGTIVVHEDSQVIKTGEIGVKGDTQTSTYVFVDVENRGDVARQVAIDGVLRDPAGAEIGPLQVDELRIPPGETRTFALVLGQVAPRAASATFRIRGSSTARHEPPVRIVQADTEPDGERLALVARLENTLDRPVVATLIATFYDEEGRILSRPFVILEIASNATRPFRFLGPRGAARVAPFLGDIVF